MPRIVTCAALYSRVSVSNTTHSQNLSYSVPKTKFSNVTKISFLLRRKSLHSWLFAIKLHSNWRCSNETKHYGFVLLCCGDSRQVTFQTQRTLTTAFTLSVRRNTQVNEAKLLVYKSSYGYVCLRAAGVEFLKFAFLRDKTMRKARDIVLLLHIWSTFHQGQHNWPVQRCFPPWGLAATLRQFVIVPQFISWRQLAKLSFWGVKDLVHCIWRQLTKS